MSELRIVLVSSQLDCSTTEKELRGIHLLDAASVTFVQFSQELDPVANAVGRIDACDPDVILIGQTDIAEEVLSRIRLAVTPLIVRWSRYYGENKPVYTSKTPSEAGYHLDMPKSTDSLYPFLQDRRVIDSIRDRDSKALLNSLGRTAKPFDGIRNWSRYGSSPPLDLSITEFAYLDDEGVDRLFAQTGKLHLESVVHKNEHSTAGKATGTLKIGKVLELFGLAGADISGSVDHGRTISEEFTENLGTIGKLKIVIDSLITAQTLTRIDVRKRSAGLDRIVRPTFVDYSAWFKTRDEVQRIAQSVDPVKEFSEFPCSDAPVTLGSSLAKYKLGFHHVRGMFGYGEAFLRVFGSLAPTGLSYYLKPFAFSYHMFREPNP